jgi:hypothetical protein
MSHGNTSIYTDATNSVNSQSRWMWTKSYGNWLKSGSEPRPLWRRDSGLNLFAGICKKPPIRTKSGSGSSVVVVRRCIKIRSFW